MKITTNPCAKCGTSDRYNNGNCKVCKRASVKKSRVAHPERAAKRNKAWKLANSEAVNAYMKVWREEKREDIAAYYKKRYDDNPESSLSRNKAWKSANLEAVSVYNKAYSAAHRGEISARHLLRKQTNLNYRLACRLRGRLNSALHRNFKTGSAVSDLGCSITELKDHLERQFQPGMSWENWSREGWHIDHIKPLASFDLTDREQFLQACHFTNLQPLWAEDNLEKGAKV